VFKTGVLLTATEDDRNLAIFLLFESLVLSDVPCQHV
jgi:hypothetical protein